MTPPRALLASGPVQTRLLRTILTAGATCGLSAALHAQLANGIKAIVHDSVITYQEVEVYASPAIELLKRQFARQPDEFRKKAAEAVSENLEQLIERQLILHDFKAAGYNLPEPIIEDAVQERIHARFGDRAKLTKTLQAQGLTYEKFRQQVRDQIIIEALRGKNISSEIIVSPHKIESHYLANTNNFKVEEQVKLRMIVLNNTSESEAPRVRRRAEEILAKIKEGATFTEMAAVNSEGAQRSVGGDWGWIDRSVLRKELSDVAFTLKAGEMSGVIETPGACYLMLVEEKRPAHVKPLSEVRNEVERIMITQERARLEKQWIDRLKKKTFIRYF